MFINTYYNTKSSRMYVWGQEGGKDYFNEENWVPYVFVRSSKGNIKTIDGQHVEKKYFNSYNDYYTFCKDNYSIYENRVKPEIQYLSETYHNIEDENIRSPKLKIYSLDIEVAKGDGGFPKAEDAEAPVVLITIWNNLTNRAITFGEKEYRGNKDTTYLHCKNEQELLRKFFSFMHKHHPHIITGWNVQNFDILYLINRSKVLFGEKNDLYKNLSPINVVRTWKTKDDKFNIDIAGVCILDYYDLYRWYTLTKLESYKLDFVSKHELDKGKLDYSEEYDTLYELYVKDWDKFVDYNIIDCKRVDELENKLGYIKLVQSLSLLTKVPMKFYNTMTHLIEGLLLVHFRRNELCAPFFVGGTQKTFEAAYVKEPQKGLWSWLFSLDIQSSYPSHIISLNISTETYFGRILGLSEERVINCIKRNEFPPFTLDKGEGIHKMEGKKLEGFNKAIKRKIFSVSPCGTLFINDKPGTISIVERNIFEKRLKIKTKMYGAIDSRDRATYDEQKQSFSDEASRLKSFQWALKILLNAMFGITAVPYSRYFNPDIAEAITSCGRYTLRMGEKYTNEIMNEPSLYSNLTDVIGKLKEEYDG